MITDGALATTGGAIAVAIAVCPFCMEPMEYGSQPSHYAPGGCVAVESAFGPPPARPKTGNKPGYAKAKCAEDDPSTWTKVCSVPGCGTPVKRTGYCAEHQAEYMILWRTGVSRARGKRRIHVKKVKLDADPVINA